MTTAPPSRDTPVVPKSEEKGRSPAKTLFFRSLLGLLLLTGIFFGLKAWLHGRHWAGTDDAFIDAHIQPVSSRIAARVDAVPVADNQFVHSGDILVQLDQRDLQVAVRQSEARLLSAQANVAKAKAQRLAAESAAAQASAQLTSSRAIAENSNLELNRAKRLRQSGAVAQEALDTATKNAVTDGAKVTAAEKQLSAVEAGIGFTAASISAAQAAVSEAESDLEKAQLDLSYATIQATQDGRVTVKSVEPGNYVQPGQVLMALVSNQVWVEANYKETELAKIHPGQEVLVEVDAYPGLVLHGHVDSIQAGSGARFSLLPPENATGNYVKVVQRIPVKIVLEPQEEESPLLGPGMSVRPEIRIRD